MVGMKKKTPSDWWISLWIIRIVKGSHIVNMCYGPKVVYQ